MANLVKIGFHKNVERVHMRGEGRDERDVFKVFFPTQRWIGSCTMTGNASTGETSRLAPEGVGTDYGKDVRNAFVSGDSQASRYVLQYSSTVSSSVKLGLAEGTR